MFMWKINQINLIKRKFLKHSTNCSFNTVLDIIITKISICIAEEHRKRNDFLTLMGWGKYYITYKMQGF